MKRIQWLATVPLLLLLGNACAIFDGPGEREFIGDWHLVSVDGKTAPAIVVSSSGRVHTEFVELELNVSSASSATLSYEIEDLNVDTDEPVDDIRCEAPVGIAIESSIVTVHPSASSDHGCPDGVIEGDQLVFDGTSLHARWDGHNAVLKRRR